jgi:predicted DNA-binding protein (MmcQ/YjbR family)
MARAQWIALQHEGALSRAETKQLLKKSYELVIAKLPKKTQAALAGKAK